MQKGTAQPLVQGFGSDPDAVMTVAAGHTEPLNLW